MRLATLILPALLTLAAPPAMADISLHVSAVVQESATQMDVTLAGSYLAIDTPKGRMIYDFKTRRRYAINTASKEYVDYSLYDVVGFRVVEMHNRRVLQGALGAAKADAPALPMPAQENELSLLAGAPGVVEEKDGTGLRSFSIGGVKLASWSEAGTKVAAADAAQFARFLRYAEGGHPQLLDMLAKGGTIPQQITFFVSGGRSVSLDVSAVQTVAPRPYDLKPYALEQGGNGIDGVLNSLAAMTPQQLAALRKQYPCDIGDDTSPEQLLDTVLSKLECTLSNGTPLSMTPQLKQAVQASPSVKLLFTALNPDKDDAEAVKTLAALRPQAPRKAYVLKVFEAGRRARMKQVKEATQLSIEALQASPVLGGVYKDLGEMLLMQYDSPRAWRCWDTGRRLAPGFALFDKASKFEAELAANQPEYF
ncbi:hypothetical protein [Duganella radicis]|uniref:DUF2330 domain-containing protein n=1 Tax=Duganella radicis TaxID=551988 RepID=A0A6L6PIW3_9BURK|nr:hypothetical protein [Duganella radicis]MTV38689.1 hypothetical protein [Duganella radicis]